MKKKLNPNFDDLKNPQTIINHFNGLIAETAEFRKNNPVKNIKEKEPKLRLYYAVKDLEGGVPFIDVESIYDLEWVFYSSGYFEDVKSFEWIKDTFMESLSYDRACDTVFTASVGKEIYVTSNIENTWAFIGKALRGCISSDICPDAKNIISVYIMEWDSFEEAYKYALELKEESHLCYSNKTRF